MANLADLVKTYGEQGVADAATKYFAGRERAKGQGARRRQQMSALSALLASPEGQALAKKHGLAK